MAFIYSTSIASACSGLVTAQIRVIVGEPGVGRFSKCIVLHMAYLYTTIIANATSGPEEVRLCRISTETCLARFGTTLDIYLYNIHVVKQTRSLQV